MSQSRDLRVVKALYFFYYAAYGVFTVFINVYYYQIGLSGVQIGLINSVAPLVGILGGPLWGMLNDKSNRPRLLMGIATAGAAAVVLGIGGTRAFVYLLPLAGLWQLFNSVLVPMIDMTNLAVLAGSSERYGRQRIWGTGAYIITTFTLGRLLDSLGIEWMFYSYCILMLGLLAVVIYLPRQHTHAQSGGKLNIRALVGQRAWLFFAVSLIPLWIAINGMYTFLGVYLKEMNASQSLIGMNSSIGAIAEMPMMLFSAFIVSRLGLKRMLGISYALYGVRFLLYGLIPSPVWALPIALMHGVTFGLFWVSGVVYVNELAPANLRTTSQTLFYALMNLAGVIGAPLGGWVFDNVGPAQLFRLYAVLCAVALGILLVGFATTRKSEESPLTSEASGE